MKTLITLLLALFLSGCASMDGPRRDAYLSAVADCGTTAAGLAVGLVELNPMGPVIACALKPVVVEHFSRTQSEPRRTNTLQTIEAMWYGFAANNATAIAIKVLALSAGWQVPLIVGAATGFVVWRNGGDEREFAALCAYHKSVDPNIQRCDFKPAS